ncbi:hypothetical protein EON82_21085 [bacterium]|nr:MAG: hypothetical protein EON82_21085 [bacterium]
MSHAVWLSVDEEIRRVRLAVMGDPEIGVVALSAMRCEHSRLIVERAAVVCRRSQIACLQASMSRLEARRIRHERAPRWFAEALADKV